MNEIINEVIKKCPETTVFPLMGIVQAVVGEEYDEIQLLQQTRLIRNAIMNKYIVSDPSGASEFFILTKEGRKFREELLRP